LIGFRRFFTVIPFGWGHLDASWLPIIRLAVGQAPQQLPGLVVCLFVLFDSATALLNLFLVLLRIVFSVDRALRTRRNHLQGGIPDDDRQAEREIQHAALTAVFEAGAGQANVGSLLAGGTVGLPAEDGKWTSTLARGSVFDPNVE
jgi:hypothetical protein